VNQELKANSAAIAGDTQREYRPASGATEFDAGVKVDVAAFEGVLYDTPAKVSAPRALHTAHIRVRRTSASSDGGYVQATYKFDKLKVGLSYGISDLKLADDEIRVR